MDAGPRTKKGADGMKGLKRRAAAALTTALLGLGSQGCWLYQDLVDPCYPDRYNYAARKEVDAAMCPQVDNGHVLNQTIWNYHFETTKEGLGTDKLRPAGLEQLAYLARRRPAPDPVVYLQTAHDAAYYDPAAPGKFAEARADLDARRKAAILNFLAAETAGRPMDFQVLVHDPAEVGLPAAVVARAVLDWWTTRPRGGLPTGVGGGTVAR
jgi:hypothetical protein